VWPSATKALIKPARKFKRFQAELRAISTFIAKARSKDKTGKAPMQSYGLRKTTRQIAPQMNTTTLQTPMVAAQN
jgi:hypothetical protein